MKLRTSLAAVGTAVVLGTTGALVLPAVASAHNATHTLKFTTVTKATVGFTRATGAIEGNNVKSGKTIGFTMLYFAATSPSSTAVNITIDTKGGFLYGTFTFHPKTGAVTNGTVTGGRSHRNDQGQDHLPHQTRHHDHLQRLARHGILTDAGRSPQRDRPALLDQARRAN
jgi:hypothetical protein